MDDLIDVYGGPFLAYVFAIDSIAGLTEERLTGEQHAVASQLREVAAQTQGQHPIQRRLALGNVASLYVETEQTTVANAFRKSCGGEIPKQRMAEDEVASLLRHLAQDIYPAFLLPVDDEDVPPPLGLATTGGIFRHPLHQTFGQAVLRDDSLKLLFPGAPDASALTNIAALVAVHAMWYFSYGRGGGFQLAMLAETILKTAYDRVLLSEDPGLESFTTAVSTVLGEVRQLAQGRTVEIPLLVSFKNVDIPNDMIITLPWGELRHRRPTDNRLIGGDHDAQLILSAKAPLKILQKTKWDQAEQEKEPFKQMEALYPQSEDWNRTVTRTSDLTRYALLLGSTGKPYLAAQQMALSVFDPLYQTPHSSWRADNPLMPAQATRLDTTTGEAVTAWGLRLSEHPKNLNTAMRRTVSAIANRTDPIDGFVDALLAWENMFSDTPETTFKVCGAITVLIGPEDLERRLTFFKELQDLYGKRSKILHGGDEPGTRDAVNYRDRAVEIALDCMRKLYEREDLLKLGNSAQRGKHVMLGATQPLTEPDTDNPNG